MIPGWDKRSQRLEEVKGGYRVRRMERRSKGRKKAMGKEGEVKRKREQHLHSLEPRFSSLIFLQACYLLAQSTLTCKKSVRDEQQGHLEKCSPTPHALCTLPS